MEVGRARTRSIRSRSPTRTPTASVICAGIVEHLDHLEWLGVDGDLAEPDHGLAQRRLGLRRRRLLRGAARDRARSPTFDALDRRAHASAASACCSTSCPNHTSEQHPWFVESRSSRTSRAPRLVRLGRSRSPTARRRTTGSAASAGRRGSSTPRTGQYYMHNHLRRAARSQLVERRRARRVRRHPAVLVRPRRRRLPHRRVQHDHQGRRAARQPARDRRRRRRTRRCSGSAPSTTATGPRCTT